MKTVISQRLPANYAVTVGPDMLTEINDKLLLIFEKYKIF